MNYCDVEQSPRELRRRGLGREHTQRERFRQETVLRFDAEHRIKAHAHGSGRNGAVAKLLCYLSVLRTAGAVPLNAHISWDRAHLQSFSASGGEVSAHQLPCQVLINYENPAKVALPPYLDGAGIREEISQLFAAVSKLPKVFNIADSRAESHCLRGALIAACKAVLYDTRTVQRSSTGVLSRGQPGGMDYNNIGLTLDDVPTAARSVGIVTLVVKDAYRVWCEEAAAAYDRAIASVEASGASVDGVHQSEEVIYILEKYRETLEKHNPAVTEEVMMRLGMTIWAR